MHEHARLVCAQGLDMYEHAPLMCAQGLDAGARHGGAVEARQLVPEDGGVEAAHGDGAHGTGGEGA